jgi:rhodanese-related sulfurtransferase
MPTPVTRGTLLQKLRDAAPVALVEALGPGYYEDVHLPGAVNIPAGQVDRLAPQLLPDTTVEVVVYGTATGTSAAMVARRLADLGYESVRIYPGGKEDWIEHGLPVERP